MNTPLFRPEAVEAQRDRLTGTVVAATPPRSGVYALILSAAGLALLGIAIFGQFASRVTVKGVVAYDRGYARVYPPSLAEVRAVHVRNGDAVRKGQPLVTIAITQGRDREGDGVETQLRQIAVRDRELYRQQRIATDLGSGEARGLGQQRANLRASIASLERQQALAGTQIALARDALARAERLARESAGSRARVEEARAALVTRQSDREQLRERTITQREALRAVESQVGQRALSTDQSVSQLAAQRADLATQRSALLRLDRLVLTSPIDGRVGDVLAEIGQHARPDTSLVSVVPDGSRLEARLYTPTQAIAFVSPGEAVRLLFDAYPNEKYGVGHGRVVDVARVPVDPNGVDQGVKSDQPLFRIRVAIDRGVAAPDGAPLPLRPGMTLTSNLTLERRPIWQAMLAPVLRGLRS